MSDDNEPLFELSLKMGSGPTMQQAIDSLPDIKLERQTELDDGTANLSNIEQKIEAPLEEMLTQLGYSSGEKEALKESVFNAIYKLGGANPELSPPEYSAESDLLRVEVDSFFDIFISPPEVLENHRASSEPELLNLDSLSQKFALESQKFSENSWENQCKTIENRLLEVSKSDFCRELKSVAEHEKTYHSPLEFAKAIIDFEHLSAGPKEYQFLEREVSEYRGDFDRFTGQCLNTDIDMQYLLVGWALEKQAVGSANLLYLGYSVFGRGLSNLVNYGDFNTNITDTANGLGLTIGTQAAKSFDSFSDYTKNLCDYFEEGTNDE